MRINARRARTQLECPTLWARLPASLIPPGPNEKELFDKLDSRFGAITCYRRGPGEVLCASSIDWVKGLIPKDPFVEKITCSVLGRYLGK